MQTNVKPYFLLFWKKLLAFESPYPRTPVSRHVTFRGLCLSHLQKGTSGLLGGLKTVFRRLCFIPKEPHYKKLNLSRFGAVLATVPRETVDG